MRRTLVLFAGIAPLLGCTLLVDLDAVRRTRDAGHQGASDAGAVDAGTIDAGTSDAGTSDAGGLDSGTPETGPYDGGARCATSTRPRLRCAAPLQLGTGGPYSNAVLQAVSSGLLAGWNTSSAVHLERVLPDGGEETWLDQPASAVSRIMLSAEGSSWALLYQTAENLPLWCFSSADDGGVSPANASGSPPVSAVAVSAAGGVAVARSDTASSGALSAGFTQRGCPRSLKSYPSGRSFVEGTWVGAAHLPGTNTEGFRFTTSSFLNAYNSTVAIWAPGADGGLDVAFGPAAFQGLEDEATAVSPSG